MPNTDVDRLRHAISEFTTLICGDSNPSEVKAAAYPLASAAGMLVGFAAAKTGEPFAEFHAWCREGFESSARGSHQAHAPPPLPNPWRALDPEKFDKGARVRERAAEVLRVASSGGLNETEVVTALTIALGQHTAAMSARHPKLTMEQLLDIAFDAIREQAYETAELKRENANELTDYQLVELTDRIIKTATANTLPIDFLTATAKALALLVVYTARRDEQTPDELLKFCQDAVSQFAVEAAKNMDAQNMLLVK